MNHSKEETLAPANERGNVKVEHLLLSTLRDRTANLVPVAEFLIKNLNEFRSQIDVTAGVNKI